jgi:hypothetical protein
MMEKGIYDSRLAFLMVMPQMSILQFRSQWGNQVQVSRHNYFKVPGN